MSKGFQKINTRTKMTLTSVANKIIKDHPTATQFKIGKWRTIDTISKTENKIKDKRINRAVQNNNPLSKLIDIFCGYGEEPLRVVLFSLLLILLCAICYFFLGVVSGGELLQFNPADNFWHQLKLFGTCLYYSVVTFTTLGYGDITPIGWSRLFAAFEAFTGSFTIALFVVVFVKKMTR